MRRSRAKWSEALRAEMPSIGAKTACVDAYLLFYFHFRLSHCAEDGETRLKRRRRRRRALFYAAAYARLSGVAGAVARWHAARRASQPRRFAPRRSILLRYAKR